VKIAFDRRVGCAFALACIFGLSSCASRNLDGTREESVSVEKQEIQRRASIRMQLAINYYQQGQYKVALDEIKQVLLISSDLADAYAVRALIFMDMGEAALADENFQYALRLAPNNIDYINNYGWFLCQTDREKQGLVYLEKVLKDPVYTMPGKAYNNAGLCSLRLKDTGAAEKYFRQGFKIDPSNPGINANLAKIHFDRGEIEQAQFYINRVIKFDVLTADVLWLAIKIEKRLGDDASVSGLATQLRRRYPNSREFSLLQRGLFNE
jgi:type IV pilus assembly protein PilF